MYVFIYAFLNLDSVFCCDIDKTGQLAVTGGEDDLAYVWDMKTGDVKLTCKDHTVKFNNLFAQIFYDQLIFSRTP